MKNPNGYGSVVKLSGKRRNPYAVRKTLGFDQRGYPIYKIIGYTATRQEGLILLAQYNQRPRDIQNKQITFLELYTLWKEKRLSSLGQSNQRSLQSAFHYCQPLSSIPYVQVCAYQMQECINSCNRSYATQSNIKNLFGHLDRFALELDIIAIRRSELLSSAPIPDTTRTVFSEKEIQLIWAHKDLPWADSVLFLLYSGFRISEMLHLKNTDIHWEEKIFIGGTKTTAGRNRIIPIHPLIEKLIYRRWSEGDEFLFSYKGHICSQSQYYLLWKQLMQKWNLSHTPHECRHTFRSRLDSAGANKVAIDRMMGHRSKDVGERIYTHKTIEELRKNIELVTD